MKQHVVTIGYYGADGSKNMAVVSPSPTLSKDGLIAAINAVIDPKHLKPLWIESESEGHAADVEEHFKIPKGRPSHWNPITSYKLDMTQGTLTLTDIKEVDLKKLHSVIDTTLGKHLKCESASGNVIKLEELPKDAQDSDSLMIDYRSAS